jgi:hypothetical protein
LGLWQFQLTPLLPLNLIRFFSGLKNEMTQGKSSSNIVTGIGTFTGTKPVRAMPTKATEEDGLKRKELELKRLKEKEEEAARKREKYLKAKAEEQKQCVHFIYLFRHLS